MKSRRVKAVARSKEFLSKKKLKGNIPLDSSDSGSDIDSDSFYHDEIDDYYKEQDDELSTDDELIEHKNESSEEEEVLPITDAEDGGDEITDAEDGGDEITDDEDWGDEDSDDEDSDDENSDEDLPNPEAWGKRKSTFYNADFVDEDRGRTYREEDEEAAKAEADEAMSIHKSVYSNITSDNLGANLFLESSEYELSEYEYEDERENLASATKHEKIKCLKKTNPEMFGFFSDYKTSISEIRDKLLPLLPLALERKLPTEACAEYIKVKYQLLMHLSLNINYYMLLKSNGTSTHNHPVVHRISSLKKFLEQMKPIDDAVDEDVKIFAENVKKKRRAREAALNSSAQDKLSESDSMSERESENAEPLLAEEKLQKQVTKRMKIAKTVKGYFVEVQESIKKRKIELSDDIQGEPLAILLQDENLRLLDIENQLDEKRTITYQIAKNKGLVARRKKEHRNPRVKHRNKFRKANIRRKGQVREVVKEITRYEGEPSGISTHVVKSIKLK